MRNTTKENLKTLASLISEEYQVEKLVNSNLFLPVAFDTAEESGVELSRMIISRYESDLKNMCRSLNEKSKKAEEVKVEEPTEVEGFIFEEPEIKMKTVRGTIILYSDGTYELKKASKEAVVNPKVKIPNYSFFVEGEDGLIITKNTYKGYTIDEVDRVAGFPAKKGWAKYMLDNDFDLTDDDREVFMKIRRGEL